jgi:hypothetical protein
MEPAAISVPTPRMNFLRWIVIAATVRGIQRSNVTVAQSFSETLEKVIVS